MRRSLQFRSAPGARWRVQRLPARLLARIRKRREHGDEGSASVEFIGAAVMLLVPVTYLVVAIAQLQAASLAIDGATRQAARVYARSASDAEGQTAADAAVRLTLSDAGIDPATARLRMTCTPDPAHCLSPGGHVTVTLEAPVTLPLAPGALPLNTPGTVTVQSESTALVSKFWGSE